MRNADGGYGAVEAVLLDPTPRVMYNLTVAVAHTFFVGDGQWLVHNTAPCISDKIAKKIQAVLDKYPLYPENSGKCDICARQVQKILDKEGFETLIGRMDTDAPKITTIENIELSTQLGNKSPAYHEFVRVGDQVFDGLTGSKGMPWEDYAKLFYEDVFTDGTIRVTYR